MPSPTTTVTPRARWTRGVSVSTSFGVYDIHIRGEPRGGPIVVCVLGLVLGLGPLGLELGPLVLLVPLVPLVTLPSTVPLPLVLLAVL